MCSQESIKEIEYHQKIISKYEKKSPYFQSNSSEKKEFKPNTKKEYQK